MKKYIIIPCILSIVGHSAFFGLFKADIRHKLPCQNPQIFFITNEQFNYIASMPKKVGDVLLTPLPKSFSSKNAIWGDAIEIIRDTDIADMGIESREDMEFLGDSKEYNFQEIQIPLGYFSEINQELLPIFSNIFITPEKEQKGGEYVIKLDNNIKMSYFVLGPVLSRSLMLDNIPNIKFDADKNDVRAKLRFWITKDGRVNQVIIEESSSYPIIDLEIINLVKTWRFSPVHDAGTPSYEWGVAHIRLQK